MQSERQLQLSVTVYVLDEKLLSILRVKKSAGPEGPA